MNHKLLLITILFIALSITGNAQLDTIAEFTDPPKSIYEVCKQLEDNSVLFYYNSRYQLVKQECAEIYRKVKIDTTIAFFDGNFTDFYLDSTIALIGCYKNGKKHGDFYLFYPNGQLQSSGKYSNNNKTGIWNYWYDSGLDHQKLEFKDNKTLIIDFWDESNKKLVDNGTGEWFIYETSERFTKIEGDVVNYMQEGKWIRSIPSQKFVMNIEIFKAGKLINGKLISMMYSRDKYNDTVFCVIEPPLSFINAENFQTNSCYPVTKNKWEYATYPGGMFNFYKEINEEFVIPEMAVRSGTTGTIVIQTTITTEGEMTNFKRISKLGYGLEDELIRVLLTMRNWTPTMINGKPTIQPKIIQFIIE